jgi:NAD(P)-dependent dehydrogenase (short-subunit alcohol dehydrogenase family)
MRLSQKIAIVTGAAQGIGLATAAKFAREGASVVVADVKPEAVEAAVAAFVASAPDPQEIRLSALAKTRPHRKRLIAWLSGLVGRDLLPEADERLWLPQFCDKLREVWALEPLGDGTANARCVYRAARPRS